jgi:hypothetical protein
MIFSKAGDLVWRRAACRVQARPRGPCILDAHPARGVRVNPVVSRDHPDVIAVQIRPVWLWQCRQTGRPQATWTALPSLTSTFLSGCDKHNQNRSTTCENASGHTFLTHTRGRRCHRHPARPPPYCGMHDRSPACAQEPGLSRCPAASRSSSRPCQVCCIVCIFEFLVIRWNEHPPVVSGLAPLRMSAML